MEVYVENKARTDQGKKQRDRRKKTLVVGPASWQHPADQCRGLVNYETRVQISEEEILLWGRKTHYSSVEALGQLIKDHPELLRSDLKLVIER